MLVVLGVDAFAFGFAHLLEDHLLGDLRCDAAQPHRGLEEFDFHVHFGFLAVKLLRFFQRNLRRRVLHVDDDLLDREQVDLAGVLVEAGFQVLVRLEVLARGGEHGVFNSANDDIGFDAFLLGERLDRLHQRVRHSSLPLIPDP